MERQSLTVTELNNRIKGLLDGRRARFTRAGAVRANVEIRRRRGQCRAAGDCSCHQ